MRLRSFELSIDKLIIRFYIMMLSVIIPFFIGIPILALLALPIFLSSMLGITIEFKSKKSTSFKTLHSPASQGKLERA